MKISARELAEHAFFPFVLQSVAQDALDTSPESERVRQLLGDDMNEYRSLLSSPRKIEIFEATLFPARVEFIKEFNDTQTNKVHTVKLLAAVFSLINHTNVTVTSRLAEAVELMSAKMEEQHLEAWIQTQKSTEKRMNAVYRKMQKRGLFLCKHG